MFVIVLFGILAVIFAFFSQGKKIAAPDTGDSVTVYKYDNFSNVCFVLSFLFLAVPCFLCGEGKDMSVYVQLYDSWTFESLKDLSFEPGYILLNLFLRIFFKNAYFALGIIKALSIYMVYLSVYLLKDRLNIGFSVLSYVVLLYIFNFHLLRMSLALGLVFLAMSCELTGKSRRAVLLMIAAFLFHYTSIIVLLAYCIYKLMRNKMTVSKVTVLSVALLLLYVNIVPLLNYLVPVIKLFNKYETYLDSANSYVGIVQLILFIPIAYILVMFYKKGMTDKFYILNTVFGIMLFFSGSLGYLLPVISRTVYYFFYSVMMLSASTQLVNDKCVFVAGKLRVNSVTLVSLLYLSMQFVITYVLNNAFVSNGLTQYTLWWNK